MSRNAYHVSALWYDMTPVYWCAGFLLSKCFGSCWRRGISCCGKVSFSFFWLLSFQRAMNSDLHLMDAREAAIRETLSVAPRCQCMWWPCYCSVLSCFTLKTFSVINSKFQQLLFTIFILLSEHCSRSRLRQLHVPRIQSLTHVICLKVPFIASSLKADVGCWTEYAQNNRLLQNRNLVIQQIFSTRYTTLARLLPYLLLQQATTANADSPNDVDKLGAAWSDSN